MGIMVEISSLEEMCDLMCDNKLPKRQKKQKEGWWYFTFGAGQKHAGKYVKIYGTFESARKTMYDRYGQWWAFQYSEKRWKEMENDPNRFWPMETELTDVE